MRTAGGGEARADQDQLRLGGCGHGAVNSGNNRMSLTKDRLTTLGDHALVFSELRQVACGVVVQKAVDNRRDMRITGGILWTTCGRRKKSE